MQENEIPQLDCTSDFLIGDASGKLLNEYARFPCKIKCGVYALMVRGTARATVNITEYSVKQNDAVMIEPNSFILFHEFSDDALVYYVVFSSSFIEKHAFGERMSINAMQLRSPLISVNDEQAEILCDMAKLIIKASNMRSIQWDSQLMVHVFTLLQTMYADYARKNGHTLIDARSRGEEIYQEFVRLVLNHYQEWHHVNAYAKAMRISTPHLSSTIKQVSDKTAGDIIYEAIITDAKSQLKISNLQIKEIAISLGFDNVAFFNRFFKAHTGMTPKTYRLMG